LKNNEKPRVLGGIGEKTSNGGRQWYMQDRIYDNNIAISIATCFNPYYYIGGNMNDDKKINVIGNYSPSGHDASRIVDENGLAPTVKENHGTVTATVSRLRIRKLTPKECFRLMGFDDASFEKAAQVNSNSQLYKQAGNSICVPVLEGIILSLFPQEDEFDDLD
jgi:site-specific DNA-cytosine methylase